MFEPKYIGRPCVVLSNNDGCVVSRSDEAKAMGIQMGEVYFLNIEKYATWGVKVWSSNYPLYGDISARIMKLLAGECPEVQVYSIDECFVKFYSFSNHASEFNFREYLLKLREKILKWFGIPVCIGVGPTKALAKVANRVAKKYKSQTKGVHIIDTDLLRVKALKWLPIEDIWGIGRRHAARLKNHNIHTAYEFTQQHDEWVRKTFSVVELRLLRDLQGKITLDFEEVKDKQNIACTRSFDKALTEFNDIAERLATNVCHAANKLRGQKSHCRMLSVFVIYGSHQERLYNQSFRIKLEYSTNSDIELTKYAMFALKAIYQEGFVYRKCGAILSDFCPADGEQLALFGSRNVKHDALMKAIDSINYRYSGKVVRLGREPKLQFKMRQDFLSPCYTTRMSDLLVVKCR